MYVIRWDNIKQGNDQIEKPALHLEIGKSRAKCRGEEKNKRH